jgi:mannitol/fructose-specific phosphotransferase system IIA component (Ntr-type)
VKPATESGRFALDRKLFVEDLRAGSRDEALAALVDVLLRQRRIHHREAVLHTLRERERLGSTAIVPGVAIPHCRSAMADQLTVLAARHRRGLDFGGADGRPVHLIFVIVGPSGNQGEPYLSVVARIARAVRDPATRAALLAADGFDEFQRIWEKTSP